MSESETPQTPIRLVCLDMAGTTVADGGTVLGAFAGALDALGVDDPDERAKMTDYVVATMGESKITVFRALTDGDEERAQAGNAAFEAAYAERISAAEPLPGVPGFLARLRESGIKIALTTGFSRTTADALIDHLGWWPLIDLSLAPQDVGGRGRPHPDLIWAAAARLAGEGEDPIPGAAIAVAGDTAGDVRSGVAAGARIVAGVLTGAHRREDFEDAGATCVLGDVTQLITSLSLPDSL
ncbi:MAG TPA: HAD family hydrolase [Actinocrinis sp.]|nr:HAD family hydrolase [Actinocrinis sp.]